MTKETIVEMYQEGRTVKEIAEQVRLLENITSKKGRSKSCWRYLCPQISGKAG